MKDICEKCGQSYSGVKSEGGYFCSFCLLMAGGDLEYTEVACDGVSGCFLTISDLHRLFPELEIIKLHGQGGMGQVYQAKQKTLDRLVALKILRKEISENPEFRVRFGREARAMAGLNHPNLVSVYDFGEREGHQYLLMEFVEGQSLAARLKEGPFEPGAALPLVAQIAGAVGFAHSKNILHRDLKPGNILINDEGEVKVTDFGLAKILGTPADVSLTISEVGMGTPNYMAPEQSKGSKEIDARADIYSLGVLFHEMLTGFIPAGRVMSVAGKSRNYRKLDELIAKSISADPGDRPDRAEDFCLAVNKASLPVKKRGGRTLLSFAGAVVIALLLFWGFTKEKAAPGQNVADELFPYQGNIVSPGSLKRWRPESSGAVKTVFSEITDFVQIQKSPYFKRVIFARRRNGEIVGVNVPQDLPPAQMLSNSFLLGVDNRLSVRKGTNLVLKFRPELVDVKVLRLQQGHDYAVALMENRRVRVAATDDAWDRFSSWFEEIEKLEDVVDVAVHSQNGILLCSDGSIVCWNTRLNRLVDRAPKQVKWKSVSCGKFHYAGVNEAGTVHAWLADPETEDLRVLSTIKIPESAKSGVIRVKSDALFSAAQLEDGSWCAWGDDRGSGLIERIEKIGPASDLSFRTFPAPYVEVYWIEPIDLPYSVTDEP